jgi:hypothetical protein
MKLPLSERGATAARRFLFEIVTITVGVLIALSFDGIADWRRERRLVREARENLQAELRGNKDQLERMLDGIPTKRAQIQATHALATKVMKVVRERGVEAARAAITSEEFYINVSHADLGESSRATAEQTGAFAHMPYQEVQRYAYVYGSQRTFLQIQERLFLQFAQVLPVRQERLVDWELADLDRWRQNLEVLLQHLRFAEQVGRQLLEIYRQRLSGAPTAAPAAPAPPG